MELIKSTNLVVRFLLELCVLGALGYWGSRVGNGLFMKIVLGVGVPFVAAVIWGLFGAPGASTQLMEPWHLILEILLFGSAVVLLFVAGRPTLGWILGIIVLINRILMYVWHQ